MLRGSVVVFVVLVAFAAAPVAGQQKEKERLQEAATVLKEIMDVPDNIPQEIIDKAECILVMPRVKKGALGIGASYGRGLMICRSGEKFDGAWTPPAMYRLVQGSIGFQIGGQSTDFVLLVMNPRGAASVINSKVKLGGDASVAGGPKGRTAEAATNEAMNAEVLTYSRSRGAFAGISLAGANLQYDVEDTEKVYGQKLTAAQVLREQKVTVTAEGQAVVTYLNQKSPKNLSATK